MSRTVVMRPDAEQTIAEIAGPQVLVAAEALAQAIPGQVPVHEGVAKRVYSSGLQVAGQGDGSARVGGLPFLWHWLEYGTRWSPPYRPIENAARGLGLTYEAH